MIFEVIHEQNDHEEEKRPSFSVHVMNIIEGASGIDTIIVVFGSLPKYSTGFQIKMNKTKN